MNIPSFQCLWVTVTVLAMATAVPAAPPTSATSDAQQIRDAALIVLDASRPFDPKALESILLESDLERQFAAEMLKAMRAEQSMGRRAAAAVGGSADSEAVRRMDQAAAATVAALAAAEPVVSGDTATMPLAPGGGRGTTLHFRKVDGRWRFDLLRRYRERGQIDEAGMARWKSRRDAAETVAKMYEDNEVRDLNDLPLLYETMSRQLAEAAAKQSGTASTTRPKE